MRRTILLITLLTALAFGTAYGLRRGQTRVLSGRVLDSMTGAAVAEATIAVVQVDEFGVVGDLGIPVKTDGAGRFWVEVPEGIYQVGAMAGGYDAMLVETKVGATPPASFKFNLDPLQPPKVLDVSRVQGLRQADRHLFTGFVVDEVSGQPMEGVRVTSDDTSTVSHKDGSFELSLPLGGRENEVDFSFSKPGFGLEVRSHLETYSYGDSQLRVQLMPGTKTRTVDERQFRRRPGSKQGEVNGCKGDCGSGDDSGFESPAVGTAPALPKNIRVGRNCPTRTTCTSVEVYSVDTYTARVLSSEWYGCWGSVAGGMNSLRAGAVAVRSYGMSFVYSPATSTYDICDTTSCQVFGSTTNSNSQTAATETTRYVLCTSAGAIARSEYSAENNNAGCGDGFTGVNTAANPCIADPVCSGFATFGHGRGLCQWGSARWATGKRLSSSSACSSSTNTGQPTKDWLQILDHYYPLYDLVQGASVTLNSGSANPSFLAPGGVTTLTYNLTATADVTVILGASIAPTGTSTWSSDSPHDLKLNLVSGASTPTRQFAVSGALAYGAYDLWQTVYYDRNNSNTINAGDFVMDDRATSGALTLGPATNLVLNEAQGFAGQSLDLVATLSNAGTPVSGRTITFTVSSVSIGSAVTNSSGVATRAYTVSVGSPAALPSSAAFAGDGTYGAASDTATVWRIGTTTTQGFNVAGIPGQNVVLTARVRQASGDAASGITVTFKVNGASVGTAVSDSRGRAALSYAIPSALAYGDYPLVFEVQEQLPWMGSSGSATLVINRRFP